MERLLVTGVDGPLGMNLALALVERFEVLGLYSRYAVETSSFQTEAWLPDDPGRLAGHVGGWRPRWMIHCARLSAPAWDPIGGDAPGEHEPVVVARLAELAAGLSARLTVISSDAVFAGPRMFHEETSVPGGTSRHAALARGMEQALAAARAMVVRTHAYGWSPVEAHGGFAERAFDALASGTEPMADGRRHATPILATDLAPLLLRAYELRLEGLYHLAGAERASPFRFVEQMAAEFGLHGGRQGASSPPLPADANGETSLCSKRARRMLERTTPMLRQGLARFAAQRLDGWHNRFRSLGPISKTHEIAA